MMNEQRKSDGAVVPAKTPNKAGMQLVAEGMEGSAPANDITARLPKGAKIYATAVAGDRLVLMLDVGGQTEIRTFDAHTLKPAGSLKFTTEP